jgi:Flp pilus assembly protein TadG
LRPSLIHLIDFNDRFRYNASPFLGGNVNLAFFVVERGFSERGLPIMIRRPRDLAKDCAGAALVEFALVLPFLLAVMVGIMQIALLFNNYIMVTNAAAAGALLFSESRGSATAYSGTVSQIQTYAANLTAGSLTIATKVNAAACTTNSGCKTALVQGAQAVVTVSYPCTYLLPAASLSWLGIFSTVGQTTFSFCPLTSTYTELVQ